MRLKNKKAKAMMLANLAIFFSFLVFFFGSSFFGLIIILANLAVYFDEEHEKDGWGPKTVNTRLIAAFLLTLIFSLFRLIVKMM
jgi:hypothetical protein